MSRTANPTPTFFHGLPAYLGGKRHFCLLLFSLLAEHLPRADWQTSRFLDPFSGGGAVSLYAKAQSFGWTIANNYSFYSTSAVGTDTSSGDSLRRAITGSAVGGTPPSPTLSVADAEGNEGDDMAFTVTLSEAAAADVAATWTASIENGDTAQAEDLGSTTGTVTVPTTDDTTDEPDETFALTLSSPSNATPAADPTATGTITDDDRGICNRAPRIRDRILVLLKYRPMFAKRLNGDRVRDGEFQKRSGASHHLACIGKPSRCPRVMSDLPPGNRSIDDWSPSGSKQEGSMRPSRSTDEQIKGGESLHATQSFKE